VKLSTFPYSQIVVNVTEGSGFVYLVHLSHVNKQGRENKRLSPWLHSLFPPKLPLTFLSRATLKGHIIQKPKTPESVCYPRLY